MKRIDLLALGCGWTAAAVSAASTAYIAGGAGVASGLIAFLVGFAVTAGILLERQR